MYVYLLCRYSYIRTDLLFFLPTSEICDTCIHGYWMQTKFLMYIHKVLWLREASQTFIPL